MSAYSKMIAAIIGTAVGFGVSKGVLPADWASNEFISALTTVIVSALTVWAAPANTTE